MNDYLIHYNHNHDALGRFARSAGSASRAVGSKLTSGKKEKNNNLRKYESSQRLAKKKKASEAVTKNRQKGSKSNNTKLTDSERKRLVESASLKEVTANKDKLSNRELEKAIERLQKEKVNRIDLEKKLYDLNKPDNAKNRESAMEKIERLGRNANTLAEAINSGTKLYNNAAMVYNVGKPKDKQLPRIGNDKDAKDAPRSWVQNIINTGDAVKAAKYASRMTDKERKAVIEGIQDVNKIKKMAESSNKKTPTPSSTTSTSSNTTTNASSKPKSESSKSSKPKSEPTIEIYDNEDDYERAVRVNNNYGNGGWKNYDSQGREWTSYDYKPSKENSSSNSSNESRRPESRADVGRMMEPKANENSRNRAEEVLKNYPEYSSGESQKMSEEERKKKYKR